MIEKICHGRTVTSLTRHIPPEQFGRYLLVGTWNTVFGYGSFAALTAVLDPIVPHGYILAMLTSSLLSITVSYLGYKRFVFKTTGNYIREWARCVVVYSTSIVLGAAILPVLVLLIRRNTHHIAAAPYIAGAVITLMSVVYSFLGHKKFSFRPRQ